MLHGEAALPYAGVIYYDFRYPSATDLMLIVEYAWGTDSFQVNIPGSYAYSERCYSIYSAWLKIDGVTIDNAGDYSHGTLSATQLLPDTFHTIQIGDYREGYGGLAFVYRRP